MILRVSNFSCIDDAELEVYPITILIGPQASGKSVLCKLCFFLLNVVKDQSRAASELQTLESFKEHLKEKFIRWFPSGTWGPRKFEISLIAGSYEIRLLRTEYRNKLGETFRLHLSEAFTQGYENTLQFAKQQAKKAGDVLGPETWQVYERVEKLNASLLRKDAFGSQIFIPAGRSFFTSMGRAVLAFEQSGNLDPLTVLFGRIYTSRLDRSYKSQIGQNVSRSITELLGGDLVRKNDQDFVLSRDGRRVPLTALSSGQQELLPLLTAIPGLFSIRSRNILYIEEPEAHLFPSAQSKLVEVFTSLLNTSRATSRLIFTTHSPYVLAKFNNLIKAGGAKGSVKAAVSRVISEEYWVTPGMVRAYALQDGVLLSIIDKDGMIDGDYLDSVSGSIAEEFDHVLEMESSGAH